MGKYVYGIDLGTTYSCIAYIDDTGRPAIISNREGDSTTPSVVNFDDAENVVVGRQAKDNAVISPATTISFVKRLMGKTDFATNYNGEDKSPEEVSSYILRKLTGDASKALDTEVKDVVITCPAYFGTPERIATTRAGEIAGLNVLGIISEPVAAAIHYGIVKGTEDKTILVFDLGGGTFDVTVMRITKGQIQVICSDGAHSLGGKNWDDALIRYIKSEFAQRHSDVYFDDSDDQELRNRVEKAKWDISEKTKTAIVVQAGGVREKIDLTREFFEDLTSVQLEEAMEKTNAAIETAREKGCEVDLILLVGGSTKMPQVTSALSQRYGKEIKVHEPDMAVAKGAAIYATDEYYHDADKREVHSSESVPPRISGNGGDQISIVVATTKSYAVQVRKNGELICDNLIIKNEPMFDGTIFVSKRYGTVEKDARAVLIKVYETDFTAQEFEIIEEFLLGEVRLELPPGLDKGAPIDIELALNTEGILSVTGRDVTNDKEVHAVMQAKGIMAAEKMEEIREKSTHVMVS